MALTADAFCHYLITRFNVQSSFAPDKRWLDENWLEKRLDLFARYCLPTVLAQTCQDFTWLVLSDEDTPLALQNRLISLSRERRKRTHVVPTGSLFIQDVNDWLCGEGETHPFLITTRLDSDDGLHRSHLATVQAGFDWQRFQFSLFDTGYTFMSEKHRLSRVRYPGNPFVSLTEARSERAATVYCQSHTKVAQLADTRREGSHPGWLQVIHDGNVANRDRKGEAVDAPQVLEREFGISLS